MALSDTHWAKIEQAVSYKIQEDGLDSGLGGMCSTFKEHWSLLSDENQLDVYIAATKDAHLQEQKSILEAELAAVEAELQGG